VVPAGGGAARNGEECGGFFEGIAFDADEEKHGAQAWPQLSDGASKVVASFADAAGILFSCQELGDRFDQRRGEEAFESTAPQSAGQEVAGNGP